MSISDADTQEAWYLATEGMGVIRDIQGGEKGRHLEVR